MRARTARWVAAWLAAGSIALIAGGMALAYLDRHLLSASALPALPEADLNVPVVHHGELLGAISVTMPKDEPLRPAGQQLVADAASQAGLVLANAGLIEDLRASRQRLITAQDEAAAAGTQPP